MNLKTICSMTGIAILLASGAATAGEHNPGDWASLFNGKDLSGWHSYNSPAPKPGWIVKDGVIVLDVGNDEEEMTGGDLVSDGVYGNFELKLEWKISPGGNSGILYGVQEIDGMDVAYETGIEMQVLDNDRHPDGKNPLTSAGACYAMYAPEERVVKPVGEYNTVRLIVADGHIEHWLNGKRIAVYDIGSDDWNERFARSKFADWPHFAKSVRGHIALQDHTDRVSHRNIRIRVL